MKGKATQCGKRAFKTCLLVVALVSIVGCNTMVNLVEGPHVYGGVRMIANNRYIEAVTFNALDLPFSFALDTALLPLTALFELIRYLTGWPPPHAYLYPESKASE